MEQDIKKISEANITNINNHNYLNNSYNQQKVTMSFNSFENEIISPSSIIYDTGGLVFKSPIHSNQNIPNIYLNTGTLQTNKIYNTIFK